MANKTDFAKFKLSDHIRTLMNNKKMSKALQ